MDPRATIESFDAFLAAHDARCAIIVIGGAALGLLGIIRRPTRDCDVLDPILDAQLIALAREFAAQQTRSGQRLDQDWLNNGPVALAEVLPTGWRTRTVVIYQGAALCVRSLARSDLLASKLWALADRGTDLGDCLALAPTAAELTSLRPWLIAQDANPEWPTHIETTLSNLGQRLGHGL